MERAPSDLWSAQRVRGEICLPAKESWGRGRCIRASIRGCRRGRSASGGFNATSFGWTALAFAWVVIMAVTLASPTWGKFDVAWLAAAGGDLRLHIRLGRSGRAQQRRRSTTGNGRSSTSLASPLRSSSFVRRRWLSLWLGGLALGAAAVSSTRWRRGSFRIASAPSTPTLAIGSSCRSATGTHSASSRHSARCSPSVSQWRDGDACFAVSPLLRLVPARRRCTSRSVVVHGSRLRVGLACRVRAEPAATAPARWRRCVLCGSSGSCGVMLASSLRANASGCRSACRRSEPATARSRARLLAVSQATVAAAYVVWLSRIKVGETTRRVVAGVAVGATLRLICTVRFRGYGSPPTLARHAYDSFVSTPTSGSDLNSRLFSLSNNGRTVLWRSALDDFEVAPGRGLGRRELRPLVARSSHESSTSSRTHTTSMCRPWPRAESSDGFVLVGLILGMPLVAAIRARAHPLVAPAFGAYVAFLVHAAVDWDWQMPAVTLLALFTARRWLRLPAAVLRRQT